VTIDETSNKPGEQAFEKMIAGLYLGEIFRLVMCEMIDEGERYSCVRWEYTLIETLQVSSSLGKKRTKSRSDTRSILRSCPSSRGE
jgi:hexokinase